MRSRASYDDDYAAPRSQSRLRFELLLGSALLAMGLFVVPAGIFVVGKVLLGPYGDTVAGSDAAGIGVFYGNFFGDLASLSGRAWTLALGPLLLITWIRLLFLKRRDGAGPAEVERSVDVAPRRRAPPPEPRAQPQQPRPQPRPKARGQGPGRRVEPRISLDS